MRYEEKKEGRGIAIEALSTAGVRVAEAYSHRKSLEEFYSELFGRERAVMKREFISAFRSEVWLLARHPATALMIALAAVLYVVAAATSSEVLIMVAGDDPYTLGGAIGFIGNLVDAGDVLGSVARTSFASTVVWIPVTILYAVYATSRDFESVAYAVSRSRGVSQAAIVITKLLVNCTLVGAVYLLSTTALYLTKMAQWDVGASC